MELAATLMWRTHINLTPMYFNKAEGCYKYNPSVLLCGHYFREISCDHSLKKTFITKEQKKFSFNIYAQVSPLEEVFVYRFTVAYSKDTF